MKKISLLAAFCGALAFAQDASVRTPKTDPVLNAEIRRLLTTIHLDEMLRQQLQTTLPPMIKMIKQNPSVSPQFAEEFSKRFESELLSSHELTDMIVEAYADRFTLSEIKDLEAFYNSPTGKKMVQVQPQLMGDVSQKAGAYGQNLAMQVGSKIMQEHPDYAVKKESVTPPPAKP